MYLSNPCHVITIMNSPLSPLEVWGKEKILGNSFTIRFPQQTDVIQLTDGGERFCAALQLTAEVEVAPVPAHTRYRKLFMTM